MRRPDRLRDLLTALAKEESRYINFYRNDYGVFLAGTTRVVASAEPS